MGRKLRQMRPMGVSAIWPGLSARLTQVGPADHPVAMAVRQRAGEKEAKTQSWQVRPGRAGVSWV